MRCKLCDEQNNHISLYDIFFERDVLCHNCRSKMNFKRRIYRFNDLEVEYFYDYNAAFQTLLLQYKECYDEALYDAFLYKIDNYIDLRYFGYKLLLAPSSIRKKDKRGFDHLERIFENVSLDRVKGLKTIKDINQQGKSFFQRSDMVDNYIYEGPTLNKVLIVDDVCTTGSTIRGIYKAIRPFAHKIKILVLAKTE